MKHAHPHSSRAGASAGAGGSRVERDSHSEKKGETNESGTSPTSKAAAAPFDMASRQSPFMPFSMAAAKPDPEVFGPTARTEMPYTEALNHWFGAENLTFTSLDIRAMRRDQFPSISAARSPDTMLQPSFKDLDFAVLPDTLQGRQKVFQDIREAIATTVERCKAVGIPVKRDPVRGIEVADTAALASLLIAQPRGAVSRWCAANFDELTQIVATLDNLPKFTIQRYVPTAWYLQDMSANHVKISPLMKRALAVLNAIARRLLRSEAGKAAMQEVLDEYSDPFGTAVGWPLFTSSLDLTEDIRDDAKIAVLAQFDGVFDGLPWADNPLTYHAMKERLKARVPSGPLQDFPLAYLVNRRSRLGGKFNPDWALRDTVVVTRGLFGAPYARIAQAAPWIGNLIQGTIFPYFKALRKMLTGCYHTQDLVNEYLPQLKSGEKFVLESDISQYDLNFAIEITDAIDDIISGLTTKPRLAKEVLRMIRRTPILMPNPENMEGRTDGIYVSGEIMLPSGIKLTAEYGTLGNVLVTICHQLASGERERDIINYWDAASNNSRARWLMQGDDKAVIGPSLSALTRSIVQEAELYAHIGTTAKVEVCDRFLQKHLFRGRMAPVAGRYLQQRLGNENAPETLEQLMMGLTTAASGMATFDANSPDGVLAVDRRYNGEAAKIRRRVVEIVKNSMEAAAVPYPPALEFVRTLASPSPNPAKLKKLHDAAAVALIARLQLEEDAPDLSGISKMLLYFDRHKYSASVADFYADLTSSSPAWAALTQEFDAKKVAFADLAYKTLKLPKNLFF